MYHRPFRVPCLAVIEFVTLFIGLVTGPHPVQVAVSGPVASVEFQLDGATIATLRGEPWTGSCDLGTVLRPHRLEAVARGADGAVLGTARQWVNLPRPRAEAELFVARDSEGRAQSARVVWECLAHPRPRKIEAILDGEPIEVSEAGQLALPELARSGVHLLSVRLEFPDGIDAIAETVFGGALGEEAVTELTAVPVTRRKGARRLSVERVQGALRAGAGPARVAAVEEGPAEVIIVRDLTTAHVGRHWQAESSKALQRGFLARALDGARLRLLVPKADPVAGRSGKAHLFDFSQRFSPAEGGVPWILDQYAKPFTAGGSQSLGDAVAVAGREAIGTNARRAVVLLLGTGAEDRSTYSPAVVRSYLRDLRVPLFVWTVAGEHSKAAAEAWGKARDVATLAGLARAVREVGDSLAAQRIVWVEGKHLPQEIEAGGAQAPVVLAGAGDS